MRFHLTYLFRNFAQRRETFKKEEKRGLKIVQNFSSANRFAVAQIWNVRK